MEVLADGPAYGPAYGKVPSRNTYSPPYFRSSFVIFLLLRNSQTPWRRRAWLLLLACIAAVGPTSAGLVDRLWGTGNNGADEILLVEEAFPVFAEVQPEQQRILFHWNIQPGYYLYRHKFTFEARSAELRLGEAELAQGQWEEDPEFGAVRVLEGGQTVVLPFTGSGGLKRASLEVTFQGCKRDTICYPVARQSFDLRLDRAATGISGDPLEAAPYAFAGGGSSAGASSALGTPGLEQNSAAPQDSLSVPGSAQGGFSAVLHNGSMWLILSLFFGAGLLLAFTPCILPMLPILSGIIVGERADGRRGLLLSAAYVLSLALAYALFGLIAGLLNYNLQAALQIPWVLILFSAVFVALALSMFGLFTLQMPAALQTRLAALGGHRAGLLKASIMGGASALIVGPCVAPAVVSALLVISVAGEPLRGAAALFALGLGMGAPLLLVGTLGGHLLPRVGPWMERVRQSFGVLMLGIALWLLGRVLPADIMLLLWAALCITVAICLGAMEPATTSVLRGRLPKALGIGLLLYGAALLVGAAIGGGSLSQPLAGLRGTASYSAVPAKASFRPIHTYPELQAALEAAGQRGRPTLLKFYADWCVLCKKLEKVTFPDPEVQAVFAKAELLQADVTDYQAHKKLLNSLSLAGPPAVLFFGADGKERFEYRLYGFLDAAAFSAHARAALSTPDTPATPGTPAQGTRTSHTAPSHPGTSKQSRGKQSRGKQSQAKQSQEYAATGQTG